MKDSMLIKILYKTAFGRLLLKILVNPNVSRASAKFLSSSFSKSMVPFFVRKNHIDMKRYKIPKGGFASFNDFFTREMKEKYIRKSSGKLISPCDGLLTVSEINEESVFHIKHTEYSLKELLKNETLAKEYQNGTAYIFRLTPAHYHRYIWAVTGSFLNEVHIQGVLHSVQPICHAKTDVFIQNTREYSVINNEFLGNVIQMEIGALLVGKISNHKIAGTMVCAGQEKGFFEYGGSSIVILTKDRYEISEGIRLRDKVGSEIPVVIGEQLIQEN